MPHEANGVGEVQPAGRHQRGIFAQAMPCDKCRLNSMLSEHLVRCHRHRQDCGLRVRRQLQRLFAAVKAQVGDREAQGLVGLVKHTSSRRMVRGKLLAHARVLRGLPREQKR